MIRYKKMYPTLLIFTGIVAFFIFCWCVPTLWILENLKGNEYFLKNEMALFLNIMGKNGNFISPARTVLYLVVFVLGLDSRLFPDKPSFVVRLSSRREYIHRDIKTILLFSGAFVLLMEVVNIVAAFLTFSAGIVLDSGLLGYSLLDFVTQFLYYMRAGLVLLVVLILTNKKISPFITFAIYFLEFFLEENFKLLQYLWLPFRDAISLPYLLEGIISPVNVIPLIVRGILMNTALLVFAYYLFAKKDIVGYEKR